MERKKMAGPEGKEEKRPNQSAQQAEQTARQAAQTAADVSGRAAAMGMEIVKRNNASAQQLWEASTQMATELTHRATDQFGRAFGLSGDDAQNVLADTSKNLGAVADFTNAITSASQEFSRQWIDSPSLKPSARIQLISLQPTVRRLTLTRISKSAVT
jgi:hypothetical protein